MMFIEECIHSLVLTPDTCALCHKLQDGPPPRIERHKVGPEFRAKFESECPGCHLPISPGQVLQKWSDNRYRHGGAYPCTP